jgi:hypothetical protein
VRAAIDIAEIDVPIYVLPFPGQGWQREYVEGLTKILQTTAVQEPADLI